jgi:hypothetical protein
VAAVEVEMGAGKPEGPGVRSGTGRDGGGFGSFVDVNAGVGGERGAVGSLVGSRRARNGVCGVHTRL